MVYGIKRHRGEYFVGLMGTNVVIAQFKTLGQAEKYIQSLYNEIGWKMKDKTPIQDKLHRIFMNACDRWSDPGEVKFYLKKFKGRLLVGGKAADALNDGVKGKVVFYVIDEYPFADCESPAAIVLPEEIALKIVTLGFLPEITVP